MKKGLAVFLIVIMLSSVAIVAGSIFAWYRENAASTAEIEDITTINKRVSVTMKLRDETVGDKEYSRKTITPARGFYPIMPKNASQFLYEDGGVWLVGTTNGVAELKQGDEDSTSIIGDGRRRFCQKDSFIIPVDNTTDRIYQPNIVIANNDASSGLSCALFAAVVDANHNLIDNRKKLIAYTDYNYGYSPVSERASFAKSNTDAFVVKKGESVQVIMISWLDSSKSNSVNIYRDASVTVDIGDYDNFITDKDGNVYRQNYTFGFKYTPGAKGKVTGLNTYSEGVTVNADKTEPARDDEGNLTGGLMTRFPSFRLIDKVAYPVTGITGRLAGIKKLVIPQSFEDFDGNANIIKSTLLSNCKATLEEAVLNGSCNIPAGAFSGWTALKKVYIGSQMKAIGRTAFDGAGITEITMEGGTVLGEYVFARTKFEKISIPSTVSYAGNARSFYENSNLREIFVDTPEVGDYMFEGCKALESIIFGPNVEKIPSKVALNCGKIKSIIIGNNVTNLGTSNGDPFEKCDTVTDLVIGRSVSTFNSASFSAMKTSLKNITMPAQAIAQVMKFATAVETVEITTGAIPKDAFSGKTSIKNVTIDNEVASIGSGAFSGCTGITRLDVLDIGAWCNVNIADANANPLNQPGCNLYIDDKLAEDLVLPETYRVKTNETDLSGNYLYVDKPLEKIGKYTFVNCSTLKSLSIPSSVSTVEDNAFSGCQIENLVAPASALKGVGSFSSLISLEIKDKTTSVSDKTAVPSSVTISGAQNAPNLKSIKIGNLVNIGTVSFGSSPIETAVAPAGALNALPSTVTDLTVTSGDITASSCQGFTSLQKLRIEEGVTTVESGSFNASPIVNLAVTSDNLKSVPSQSVTHLEIIDKLSVTEKDDKGNDVVKQQHVQASDINEFANLKSIQISDYTTIDGSVAIPTLDTAIVSGGRIAEILGATNTASGSTIINIMVIGGTIAQEKSEEVYATGFSFWRGVENATLTIADGVIVEDGAFKDCNAKIETAVIPANAINPMLNFNVYTLSRDSLKYVTVTSGNIPDNAFAQCTALSENVIVKSGVTGVGENAFGNGKITFNTYEGVNYVGDTENPYYVAISPVSDTITSVVLHSNCKYIAEYAFAGTMGANGNYSGLSSLTEVEIPNETKVTDNAFYGSHNIQKITAPAGAIASIPRISLGSGENAVSGNETITEITITSGSVTREAFANFTKLSSVTLKEGVTTLNGRAFENCPEMQSIVIENKDIIIASTAFYGCESIATAVIPASVIKYVPKTSLIELIVTSGEIGEFAMSGTNVVRLTLGKDVTAIKYKAFDDCKNLTEVFYVNKDTEFEKSVPSGSKLKKDVTDEHFQTILASPQKRNTESNLEKLNDDTIIYKAQKTLDPNVTNTTATIVRYVGNSGSYTVPSSVTDRNGATVTITGIDPYAFYGRKYVDVDFSNASNLTAIGEYAFYGCEGIKKLDLSASNGLTTIGNNAFYACSGMSSAVLNKVATVGNNAFYACGRLVYVNAPSVVGLTAGSEANGYLAYYAKLVASSDTLNVTNDEANKIITYVNENNEKVLLNYYGNETEFAVPSDIAQIGAYAFYNQDNLKEITISPSVKGIGDFAFVGCSQLEKVIFSDSSDDGAKTPEISTIGKRAFNGCAKLISIDILKTVTSIGEEAFMNCSALKTVNIESGSTLQTIGNRAFMNCSALEQIDIPDSTTDIGMGAFYQCVSLKSATIGSNVTTIGKGSFFRCIALTSVTFNEGSLLTTIDVGAFNNCINLISITLPEKLTHINNYAFAGCLRLAEVIYASGEVPIIEIDETDVNDKDYAFHHCITDGRTIGVKLGVQKEGA